MELLSYISSYGDGNGYGDGDGNGNGYGDGDGNGNGYGDGVIEFEGVKGYNIDGILTFLENIHGNIGKGFTLRRHCKRVCCYVYLTDDGFIAHGETLHKARESAFEKSIQSKPIEQRLQEFVSSHPDIDNEYGDLFQWHHILTGSCEFGRKQWCETHGLKPTDSISVRRFINETTNDYGGDIIRKLANMYGIKEGGEECI